VTDPTVTPAWKALEALSASIAPIRELVDQERNEFRSAVAGVEVDFSRQRIDSAVWKSLKELVEQCDVGQWRDHMLTGTHINTTEDRAVLHTALRLPRE
jgi:glucose-6-phosphate isomerase